MTRRAKRPQLAIAGGHRRLARGDASGSSVAKTPVRRKPDEGATPGMTIKKTTQRQGFKTSEFIVYPSHGVGQIVAIEEQEVAGAKLGSCSSSTSSRTR